MRTHVLDPLDMRDSFVYDREHASLARATGYVSHGASFTRAGRNTENFVYGDGQINTTIDDLAKWARAPAGADRSAPPRWATR